MKRTRNILPCMAAWLLAHDEAQDASHALYVERKAEYNGKSGPKVYAPVTEEERYAIKCLGGCTFTPASYDKRFARDAKHFTQMTERGRALLWRMVYRYRRQITDKALVELAKRKVDAMNLPAGSRV